MYDRIKDLLIGEAEEPKKEPKSKAQSATQVIKNVAQARKRRRGMDADIARMAGMEPSKSKRSRPDTSLGD